MERKEELKTAINVIEDLIYEYAMELEDEDEERNYSALELIRMNRKLENLNKALNILQSELKGE